MEDSQREAMFNAWKKSKKWIEVELFKKGDYWVAQVSDDQFTLIEPSIERILAIQGIQGKLALRGYEISNLFELFEYKLIEKKTFVEWCKEIDNKNKVKSLDKKDFIK